MPVNKHTFFSGAGNTTRIKLIPTPIMKNHDGYDCKVYAVSGVLDWLHKNKFIAQSPLPARKHDYANYHGDSLRKLAKSKLESAVGEIHNIDMLVKLANHHSEVNANYYQANTYEEFVNHLVEAIHQEQAPIVFYDINTNWDSTANPISASGKTEHAVIVVGYEKDHENQLTNLLISTWDDIFPINAKELFHSSAQLPTERSKAEIYNKIYTYKTGLGAWLPEEYFKNGYKNTIHATRVETSKTSNHGLGKKILTIGVKMQSQFKHTLRQ